MSASLMLLGCSFSGIETSSAQTSEWQFADMPAPVSLSIDSLRTFSLTERARYGTWDGLGALDAMNHLVVTDSLIIASLVRSCEFVVFERKTSHPIRRFGKCGQGPDEFENMVEGTLGSVRDTLLVFDKLGRRARKFSTSGELIQTFELDTSVVPIGSRIWKMAIVEDSLFLIALHLPPHTRRNGTQVARMPEAPYLRLVNSKTSEVLAKYARDGPGVATKNFSVLRTPVVCSSNPQQAPVKIATANRWESQFVLLTVDRLDSAYVNVAPPFSRDLHSAVPDARGRIMPEGSSDIACGDSAAIYSLRFPSADGGEVAAAEMFAYWYGQKTAGFIRVDQSQDELLGRLIAARGNRFFMLHSTRYDFPVIIEFELGLTPKVQPKATGVGSGLGVKK